MRISDWSSDVCSSDLRGERWKLMLKLNLHVPLLFLLLLPFLVMFLPLQKRRAKKRNNKTQKTSATSGLLTVLRPSAKRKKNNSKERLVSKERVEIGRAHVRTPVTNAHLVCSLLLEKQKN